MNNSLPNIFQSRQQVPDNSCLLKSLMKNGTSNDEFCVGAVVVLYFPNEALLIRLLVSIRNEVNSIFVVDNTPIGGLVWLSEDWFLINNFNVIYRSLGDNYGIAKAQNYGIEQASVNGCNHIILFDQDSSVPLGMLEALLAEESALINSGINVGAVGPSYIDENTGALAKVIRFGNLFSSSVKVNIHDLTPLRADVLVASGCLIRLKVLQKTGLMREDLFIDGVDVEWSLRAGFLGFKHFVIPKIVMNHNMGDTYVRIGRRKIILHSDLRHYYSIRNHCNLILNPIMGRNFRLITLLKIPLYVLIYSFLSKTRFACFIMLLRACLDGFSGKLGKTKLPL